LDRARFAVVLSLFLSALAGAVSAAAQELAPGAYRLDMRQVHSARFPLLGRTRTAWVSVALARIERADDDSLRQEHRLCDVRFESGLPLVEMIMPEPMRESLGRPHYPVELSRSDDGWHYHADLGFEHVGYVPREPGERLPRSREDSAVVDSDHDGKPGATLHLDVPLLDPFELYVVQRGHAVLDGELGADGRIEGVLREGVLRESLEQVVIGSDPYFLKRSPKLEPDPERSRFALTPVPDDTTCASLLGDEAAGSEAAVGEPGPS
jgi:hypothetical protein